MAEVLSFGNVRVSIWIVPGPVPLGLNYLDRPSNEFTFNSRSR
jgi:hypothetical protein